MRRTTSKRSHSWWWDSHISPKNSKWLAENLEEMDQAVKRMLRLIEEDADSFAKKAEMYYQKRPELILHVEDFYRMYRALAERYDHVTGELRKNIPTALQTQGSGSGSDFGSESPSPSPSPSSDNKPAHPIHTYRAAGFDFFLGSDLSHKDSDGPSSSDSESDSLEATSRNHILSSGENRDHGEFHQSRALSKSELVDAREKLQALEAGGETVNNGKHESVDLKITKLEDELSAANEKIQVLEEETARLKHELELKESLVGTNDLDLKLESSHKEKKVTEQDLEIERSQARNLQEKIVSLETEILNHQHTIDDLKTETSNMKMVSLQEKQEVELGFPGFARSRDAELLLENKQGSDVEEQIVKLETELSDRETMIQDLKAAIFEASERFSMEKLQLNREISTVTESHRKLESSFVLLDDEIKHLKAEKMEKALDLERTITENSERVKQIALLNRELDELKLRHDTVSAEKEELFGKLQLLVADLTVRDNRIKHLNENIHQLHLEHIELMKSSEDAKKVTEQLNGRVKELEEEVERQRGVIADFAEEKREAIRQLCISLEHYRDGYEELKKALHEQKSPTVLAS